MLSAELCSWAVVARTPLALGMSYIRQEFVGGATFWKCDSRASRSAAHAAEAMFSVETYRIGGCTWLPLAKPVWLVRRIELRIAKSRRRHTKEFVRAFCPGANQGDDDAGRCQVVGHLLGCGQGYPKTFTWIHRRFNKLSLASLERTVSTDMSVAYIWSVFEHPPGVAVVLDHVHVIKPMNDILAGGRKPLRNCRQVG